MDQTRRHTPGFARHELLIVLGLLVVVVALLLPALGYGKRHARMRQNNIQLRGIVQGFMTFSQGSKSGGVDGWYTGVDSRGRALEDTEANTILPDVFGQNNAIHGYAASRDNIALDEMNDPDTGEGFMQYAFAKLMTGDFIPSGSPDYLINPNDSIKTRFQAGATGDAGRFDMSKVSYTVLNIAVEGLEDEWTEKVNIDSIILADRVIGNGDTLGQPGSTAHSVWTEPGSGTWFGGAARNDASTGALMEPGGGGLELNYGALRFENDTVHNLFAHPDDETLGLNDAGEIRSDQGVLFDQDEGGRVGGV